MGLEQMLLVQKARLPIENAWTDMPPDFVVHRVPEHRRPQQDQHAHGITEVPRSGHGSRREQQRIAGQKRRDHKACFAKDHDKQKKIQHGPVFGDEREQVLVDMQDKGNRLLQKRNVGHGGFP